MRIAFLVEIAGSWANPQLAVSLATHGFQEFYSWVSHSCFCWQAEAGGAPPSPKRAVARKFTAEGERAERKKSGSLANYLSASFAAFLFFSAPLSAVILALSFPRRVEKQKALGRKSRFEKWYDSVATDLVR